MTFLLPLGLLSLLSLPLIVVLHLREQRRVRQRVPSLEIWRELQRPTPQPRPRRLPLTLLLVLHLLLAALLGLALGQPLLAALREPARHVALIIDTSSSMAATDAPGSRLTAARDTARRMLSDLRRGDSAALIELSATPRLLAQGDGSDRSALLRQLDHLVAGGPDGDLPTALNLAQASAPADKAVQAIVLTDRALRAPATIALRGELSWRVFGTGTDNVAIVAFAARPLRDGRHQLYARVANLGATPIARTLFLDLDGRRVASEPMRLAPGSFAEWSWPLPAGTQRAEASLSGSDILPLDDRAGVVLQGAFQARVLLVSAADTPLERALRALRGLQVERLAPDAYRGTQAADLVVFVNTLPSELPDAPVLIVAPPPEQTLVGVEERLSAPETINVVDARFGGIDFGPVTFERWLSLTPPPWASVAVESNGAALVLTGRYNGQPIALWGFDPADSNLPYRLAFPLLTAATIEVLLPQTADRLPLGAPAPVDLRREDGLTVAAGERLRQPGLYRSPAGGALAVNADDASESNLQPRPQPTVRALPAPVPAATDPPVGRELWRPLIVAALLVLALEWLYIHRRGSLRTPRAHTIRP